MTISIIDFADAVVDDLNAATLSQPIVATRKNVPHFESSEFDALTVTVVPYSVKVKPEARRLRGHEFTLSIAVQKRVDDLDAESIALDALLDEISAYVTYRRNPTIPEAAWLEMEKPVVLIVDHAEAHTQYSGVIRITWKVVQK